MNDRSVHIFDIYQHPEDGLKAVRRGFSWEAFLLPALWAVRRELGWTAFTLFVLTTAVFDIAGFSAALGFGVLEQCLLMLTGVALLGMLPGFDGYRWLGKDLERKGYDHLAVVAAASRRHALEAACENRYAATSILVAAG